MDMQTIWDRLSEDYFLRMQYQDQFNVGYGPFSPSERELNLLDQVAGTNILDIGCGAGQNAVAMARAGANVTALDISEQQLSKARRAAHAAATPIQFIHANAESIAPPLAVQFDTITCIYTLPYLRFPAKGLANWRSLLRRQGKLIISFDHPTYTSFMDRSSADLAGFPVESYLEEAVLHWPTIIPGIKLPYRHKPISAWIDQIVAAGYQLLRILEPPTPDTILDDLWPDDSPVAPIRNIPHTIIFIASPRSHDS